MTVVKILAPDYRNPTDDTGHPELSSLALHSRQTFGNFSLRQNEKIPAESLKDLKNAFEAARDFAEHPRAGSCSPDLTAAARPIWQPPSATIKPAWAIPR